MLWFSSPLQVEVDGDLWLVISIDTITPLSHSLTSPLRRSRNDMDYVCKAQIHSTEGNEASFSCPPLTPSENKNPNLKHSNVESSKMSHICSPSRACHDISASGTLYLSTKAPGGLVDWYDWSCWHFIGAAVRFRLGLGFVVTRSGTHGWEVREHLRCVGLRG